MSNPKRATTSPGGSRWYDWRGERFWSVTTIINGGTPKPALINWAKKFTAEYACDNIEKLNALLEPDADGGVDRDGAVGWLKGAAFRDRDRAADLGSLIHATTEAHALGKPMPKWPKIAEPQMAAFLKFLDDCKPEYLASEASVYNRSERYAGTLDAIAKIDGRTYLIDTKTGKGVYPEVALQLAAYRYAEFIGLPDGDERAMYDVDDCACLHLPKEGGYQLLQVRADEEVFQSFLYVREVFRWQEETSKNVIGGDIAQMNLELRRASGPLVDALAHGVASGGIACAPL